MSGDMYVVVRCQDVRALALLELGRLDDARAEVQATAQAAEELGLMYYLGRALAVLVETSIRQGDLAAANAAADRLVSRCPPGVATGDHCWASALCADTRGRPEVALAALAPVLERLRRSRFYFATWYPSRLTQVTALAMRAGDAEQAGVVVQAAAELSRRNPGADLWERDARSDAARAALSAGQAYDDLWWLPEVMRMRAAHDDAAAAFSRLRTAAQMASAQGSVALLRRCERDLTALPPTGVRQVR